MWHSDTKFKHKTLEIIRILTKSTWNYFLISGVYHLITHNIAQQQVISI